MKEKIILLMLIFGLAYSFYVTAYVGDLFIGFVLVLLTLGLSSTIYALDRKIDYRIIFYMWIAIIASVICALLFNWAFGLFGVFQNVG